jgi:hypothetical protein
MQGLRGRRLCRVQWCRLAIRPLVMSASMYPDLSHLAEASAIDVDAIRARLRKLSDAELIRYGQNCAFLCSPKQNFGKPPLEVWTVQLDEARAEWRRRQSSLVYGGDQKR